MLLLLAPRRQHLIPDRAYLQVHDADSSLSTPVCARQVHLSVVEIYCERIRDLLDPSRDNLPVKQDAQGAMFVDGGSACCAAAAAMCVDGCCACPVLVVMLMVLLQHQHFYLLQQTKQPSSS